MPANISVITEEEIQNSPARDVPDLLRTEAGVHVSDISGNRRSYSVDLRGFGETASMNTLVLVDGRKINSPDLSATDWTLIPVDRIERIEIIRGGRGSVLYGDNAAGGAINIITKQGKGFDASAEIAGGSYDTGKANAQISGSHKDLSYSLTGSYLTSDGYRDNSDTRAKDVGANLDYFASDRVKLYLSSGYHEDKTGLPGGLKESDFAAGASRKDSINPNDFADVEDYYIKAGPEVYFLNNSMLKFDFSYRNRESLYFSSFSTGTFEGDTEIETVAVSPRVILDESIFGFNNNLTIGADFSQDKEDIVNTTIYPMFPVFSGTQKFKLEKRNYGFYIHEEFHATPELTVSGGYRYDRSKFKFSPSTPDSTTTSEDLYTAGIVYQFLEQSQVYASYSKSFRNPVLDEFFDFTTNTINTGLKSQTGDNYEIGIRHHFSDTFYGHINFFRIDTENELYFNPITYSNENFDSETRRDGVEVSLGKDFKHVKFEGSYAYTDAEIRGGEHDGNDFPSVPEHQASATTTFYPTKNLSISLNGVYVGERPFISDFANEFEDQDDYFVANTKIRYQWDKMSAYLNVNNLFNKEYEEYGVLSLFSSPVERAYYPSPKINFLLGFTMEL
ncbi:MAG: TonB-dependent receptor [Desulfosalsimonas sp.]|uniref:TonB-dependent receptor n=1 Tax=Desulfosalsimonas sp. TaxID=3073848 RepID=UPI0039708F56